jgi:exonuclease SbcD
MGLTEVSPLEIHARPSTPLARQGKGVRVLFLADTHLGFDLPVRPMVGRRRRGHDFLAMYERALEPAQERLVDLVIHGGDLFHRARVPATLAHQAIDPLRRLADAGIPVLLVPGNHERSRIPHAHMALHPRLHVFGRPSTVRVQVGSIRIAVSGFPYHRRDVRTSFSSLLHEASWAAGDADIRLLLLHHCVEGATVGPADFTFRRGRDVIRGLDLPTNCAAVLSGHIHRHQVLTRGLDGARWPTSVVYPGSTERTSFAEIDEQKGYLVMDFLAESSGGRIGDWEFVPLPARTMVVHDLELDGRDGEPPEAAVIRILERAPADAIVRLRLPSGRGLPPAGLSAQRLRELTPPGLNVQADWLRRPPSGGEGLSETSPPEATGRT